MNEEGREADELESDGLAFDETALGPNRTREASPPETDQTAVQAMASMTGEDLGPDEHDGRRRGMVLTQNLILERPLGKGGMGSLWVARHLALDSEVAVKFIADRLADRGDSSTKRFEREARLAAKMKSPHAVKVFDHGRTDDGVPYIAMELLDGESLAERLKVRLLTPGEAARVVQQVAEVLREAHLIGIVHRDIKPHNIFLTATSYEIFVKVLDFGVARHVEVDAASAVTETGALVGTPYYMSPEQLLRAEEPGVTSDLWALAVLAYQAITGRLPFEGDTVAALGAAISKGAFTPVTKHRASLPPALDDWFARALASDASERFADVRSLAQAFAAACDLPLSSGGLDSQSDAANAVSGSSSNDRTSRRSLPVAPTLDGSSTSVGSHRPPRRLFLALGGAVLFAMAGYAVMSASSAPEPPAAAGPMEGAASVRVDLPTSAEPTGQPTASALAEPEPSASASRPPSEATPPTAAPAENPAPRPADRRRRVPKPPTTAPPEPSAPKAGKPGYCSDPKRAFFVNDDGISILRPECL
ncbi:MAG: protein kinase [Polyangiaceae bacterium]